MGHDIFLLLMAMIAAAPGTITAIGALVTALHTRSKTAANTKRLDTLENGGGDKKIDDRLAVHGIIDRRVPGTGETPVSKDDEIVH